MAEKLAKPNQSVEKTFQIIEIMAENGAPMQLQTLAVRCNMPASTVLRMLNTLLLCGYVKQDAVSLRYSLTLKFAHLGNCICAQNNLRDIAHPFLEELSRRCRESCCLAIEENMEVVYTDVRDGPDNMLKAMQRIGKRAPMHATGVGKLLLLNYSQSQLDFYVANKGLPALTRHTLTTKEALVAKLAEIRQQGYALDDEECELGARCVAAPILDYSGHIVAGLSVSGPIFRITEERVKTIAPVVMGLAGKISEQMGYSK